VANGIVQHHDWLPTFLAMAGAPDVMEELKTGYTANGKHFRNHIDGFNLLPYLTGEVDESPRNLFFYFSDDGDVLAIRYDNWKLVFMEQRQTGTLQIWMDPFIPLRAPKLFNLRTDPYERADITSNTYFDWLFDRVYTIAAAQVMAAQFAETFVDFPPAQKAASFNLDSAMAKMLEAASGALH
jgi:arylsulfatase